MGWVWGLGRSLARLESCSKGRSRAWGFGCRVWYTGFTDYEQGTVPHHIATWGPF